MLERGPVGFWSGSWPSTTVSPPPALPNDPVDLLLFVVRIVTDEQHLTGSEMASPAYAGPVIYIRTIIDSGDIVKEIPEVPPYRLAELRRAAEEYLCFYSLSTNPTTTTSDPVAAAPAELVGGARSTTTSDPVAAAPAEPAGGARSTTTSDSVAAAPAQPAGGARSTTTSDPVAAAPAELAGGARSTTTSDPVAAAPAEPAGGARVTTSSDSVARRHDLRANFHVSGLFDRMILAIHHKSE